MTSSARRWGFRLAALAMGTLLAALLLELLGAGVYCYQQTAWFKPELRNRATGLIARREGNHWRGLVDTVFTDEYGARIRYNRLGFRGPDFDPVRLAAARQLILGLGDSCMLGVGVPEDSTVLAAVLRELVPGGATAAPGPAVNLGVSGLDYHAYQEQLRYAFGELGLAPAAVVVMLCANDIGGFPGYQEYAFPKKFGLVRILPYAWVESWRDWSYFHRGLLQPYYHGANFRGTPLAALQYRVGDELPERWRRPRSSQVYRMILTLRAMQDACDAREAASVFIILPAQQQVISDDAFTDYQDELRRLGAAAGMRHLVDPLPWCRAQAQRETLMLDTLHPAAELHRQVARLAAAALAGDRRWQARRAEP